MFADSEKNPVTARWINRMAEVRQTSWDALALGLETPLLEWEWLNQMETSGSISPETGWEPNHLTLWRGSRLIAAAPLYIKIHNEGEFIPNSIWEDAANRLGVRYFPKMVGMSPVSPVSGYRILMAVDENAAEVTSLMISEIDRFCRDNHISGASFLFADPAWASSIVARGYVWWMHQSFIWENQGFANFDDYLAVFKTNQRRNIRRERDMLRKQGLVLRPLQGDEIPPDFVPLIYRFYEDTNDRYAPWNCKYLYPAFFEGIYERYRHRLLLMTVSPTGREDSPVGMSLLLIKGGQLLGRYWGCGKEIPYLHFNTCYYGPVEWAIHHGISAFNPGAGGDHKIRRGFKSVPAYSLHRFYDSRMDAVMRFNMREINRREQVYLAAMNESLPFSRKI